MVSTQKNQGRVGRSGIERTILRIVLAAGTLSIALLVPNALGALYKTGILPSPRRKDSVYAARERLIKKKYLTKSSDGFLTVTPLGRRALAVAETRGLTLNAPKRWDKRWRVLIFDIPESKKRRRRSVVSSLRTAGFERVQDSVWAYPHDCKEFVSLLKAELHIGRELLYLVVDSFEGDRWLRQKFSL